VTVAAPFQPGTVLCTRSPGFGSWWIRFGAAIRGKPNLQNHVAVVHHADKAGTTWAIEGRPGGAGWKDATGYLNSKWTISNAAQPVTEKQGGQIAHWMEALLGSEYDWQSIIADGLADLGIRLPGWEEKWADGQVNVQAVCSSLAAYAYAKAGVPHPPGGRGCQPSDWTTWILTRAWES